MTNLQRFGLKWRKPSQDFTAGLNWYPDRNIRMMADYVHGWVSPAASVAELSTVRREVQSDAFVGRMQVYW